MESFNVDIVIVGGGIAGFAAAIGAVEEGASVLMVEKEHALGGNATMANVGTVCGAYYKSDGVRICPVGYNFSQPLLAELGTLSHTSPRIQQGGLVILPYEWDMLQQIIERELAIKGITLWTDAAVTGATSHERNVTSLSVIHAGKPLLVEPGAVVDCSGQGIVSSLLDLEMLEENGYQAASQQFRIQDINTPGEYQLEMALKRAMARLVHEMKWRKEYTSLSVVPGSLRDGHADLKFTLPDVITDDPVSNARIAKNAREDIVTFFPVLKENCGYLAKASIQSIFPQLGIRVMRRSKGIYILSEGDVCRSGEFDDCIAIGTWPIEEWGYDGRVSLQFSSGDHGYDIPAGCLTSSTLDNLYFGGKNISATTRAIASARVMGTCLQTGYAAGKIACTTPDDDRQFCIQALNRELTATRI